MDWPGQMRTAAPKQIRTKPARRESSLTAFLL
jgi:hypothetical protein